MTYGVTYKRAWRFSTQLRYGLGVLLFAVWLFLPSLGKAQIEGIRCAPEPTDMFINYGNLVNCKIDPIKDVDFFRFSGAVGELIRVQIARQDGLGQPTFEVFGPDGAAVTSCSSLDTFISGAADCQLTLAGTYTIRINEQRDDGTVDYGLALERIVPLSVAAQPLASGQTRADEINAVGDIDAFFFSGNANDLYFVQIAGQSGFGKPVFEVFSPDGNLLCAKLDSSSTGTADCPLTQTGAHTILVNDLLRRNTVQYSLSLQCVSGNCPLPPPPPPPPESGPATPQTPIPCTGSRCRLPVTCNLPPALGTPCSNRIDLIAFVPRSALRLSDDSSTRAPSRIRFASRISNIPPGATADVRLRLTRTGKQVARRLKRSLIRVTGVLEIRNTAGTVINSTQVKIRIRRR
jgi:hypothetical protein